VLIDRRPVNRPAIAPRQIIDRRVFDGAPPGTVIADGPVRGKPGFVAGGKWGCRAGTFAGSGGSGRVEWVRVSLDPTETPLAVFFPSWAPFLCWVHAEGRRRTQGPAAHPTCDTSDGWT